MAKTVSNTPYSQDKSPKFDFCRCRDIIWKIINQSDYDLIFKKNKYKKKKY